MPCASCVEREREELLKWMPQLYKEYELEAQHPRAHEGTVSSCVLGFATLKPHLCLPPLSIGVGGTTHKDHFTHDPRAMTMKL